MAKPRSSKKREPGEPTVLPMELQLGDRITDETGEWEVIRPPYSTAGGRIVHARVQRIGAARQLGDSKLGRFQAHQRGASDRRGWQRMMRRSAWSR